MVLFLLGTAMFQQCTDEGEKNAAPQKVQFTFSYKSSNSSGGRLQQDVVPDALLLSLQTALGDPVFVSKRIGLLHVGESYITEPLEMTPGTYAITDFMLAAGDSVIYLTPLDGSPLSKAVNHPLPYPLIVNRDRGTTLDMEVIAVGLNPPEDYGYASFNINTMNPFRISVFTGTTLASATAYILEGWDTIWTQSLDAGINLLSFPGNPQRPHKLVVTKPGYSATIKPFYYDELVHSLNGLPLKIKLEPAVFTIHPASSSYSMRLMGKPGTLNIDWGDGTLEHFILRPDSIKLATHTYTFGPGCCPVNVTGDIDKILLLNADYSDINDINVQGLSGLIDIRLGHMQGPGVVDFTHNFNLYILFMPDVSRLKQVILPPASIFDAYLIDITGPNQITTSQVDALIEQAYLQVKPPVAGSLMLNTAPFSNEFVGPPSPAGMDKLRALHDTYHWYITPDPN